MEVRILSSAPNLGVAKWQPRGLQVAVFERTCGFDSLLRDQKCGRGEIRQPRGAQASVGLSLAGSSPVARTKTHAGVAKCKRAELKPPWAYALAGSNPVASTRLLEVWMQREITLYKRSSEVYANSSGAHCKPVKQHFGCCSCFWIEAQWGQFRSFEKGDRAGRLGYISL